MEQSIYIELDAILDTRLATISRINQEAATRMLGNEAYYKRLSDEFWLIDPTITEQAYKDMYAARNWETLQAARPSGLLVELINVVQGLEKRIMVGDPEISKLNIDVNIYPYDLNEEEIAGILDSIKEYCGVDTTIAHVNIPYSKISTEHIRKANWAILYMYNFFEWESAYFPTLKEKPHGVPSVSLVVPDLIRSLSMLAELEKEKPKMETPLTHREVASIYFSEIIGITHSDIMNWSIIIV